ncbi:MAG: HD domain-containing protein [Candidatus Omnitrophota bacterium]|nr:HD domain-containing protein [Candidatus Omnitrophota bacterium]
MKELFKIRSIKNDKLERNFLLAFILVSLLPLLLLVFIVNYLMIPKGSLEKGQSDIIVFFLGCASLVGFYMIRRMIKSFVSAVKSIKTVANGNLSAKIESDGSEEINELAKSFNRITKQMEENIRELQHSKQLLQQVLSQVGEAVSSFQNIDKFLELIVLTIIDALAAKNGRLMLLNPDTNELITKISFGDAQFSASIIKLGEGLLGQVAKEGKTYLVSASQSESGKAGIYMPLIYSNKIIGVFALSDKKDGRDFTPDDEVLLKDLASQIAIAFENYRLSTDAERTYVETVTALAMAVEARDHYTRGHNQRVGEYCRRLAKEFNLDSETIQLLTDASNLHDIGKIGIPDEVLHKTNPLTEGEMRFIHEHPIIGENIMRPIRSLSRLCDLVRHHHEQLDGKGYPDGLRGEEISLPLNIMIVADVFDAMTSDRPYRRAISFENAKEELRRYAGIRYHNDVVEKFLRIV